MKREPLTPEQVNKVTRCKIFATVEAPFLGGVFMSMDAYMDDSIPTAGTDGYSVWFNPQFFESLPIPELAFIACHEAGHKALLHFYRRGSRHPKLWNLAGDFVINYELTKFGGALKMPSGGWYDEQYADLCTEEVYEKLLDKKQNNKGKGKDKDKGKGKGKNDPGGSGGSDDEDFDGDLLEEGFGSGAKQSELEARLDVIQAARTAVAQGRGAGLAQLTLDSMLESTVGWRDRLRRFMTDPEKSDFTWARPSRRTITSGIYLPSQGQFGSGEVVVFVDVSGSVLDMLQEFGKEINAVHKECRPTKLHVVYGDDGVRNTAMYRPGEVIKLASKGGGGTDFRPLFRWVDEQGIKPKCAVFLTDLYGTFPDVPPEYPVLWATNTKGYAVPFGETVIIK